MAAAAKPVILLVHGAFHPPHFYRKLIEGFRAQGFTILAPPLPSTGLDDSVAGKTYADDVRRIHETAAPYFSDGREVILLCHSQGGVAGSAATEGQTVEERGARGLPGGIRAIVYLAAFAIPQSGVTLGAILSGDQNLSVSFPDGPFSKVTEQAAMAFYNMSPSHERSAAFNDLVYQSLASKFATIHFAATDVLVPKTYIVCTQDQAAPPPAQRAMAAAAGCRIVEIESDHSPFLRESSTEQVVNIVASVANP
ncbi:Alpha/beta hydrolase fold-1 [Xylariales sp. PMI_506]|nr:Alpha/beta hydrolase fold-1 [Xylariales sp. PMI_506]